MNSATFMFCKRCGAVTKPGVCSYCGYDNDLWLKNQNNPDGVNEEAKPGQNEAPVTEEVSGTETAQVMDEASAADEASEVSRDLGQENTEAVQNTEGNSSSELPEYQVEEPIYSNVDPELLKDEKKKKVVPFPFLLFIIIPAILLLVVVGVVSSAIVPLVTTLKKPNNNLISSNPGITAPPSTSEKESSEKKGAVSEDELEEGGEADVGLFGERKTSRKNLGDSFDIENYISGKSVEYSDETNRKNDGFLQPGYASSFGTDHTNKDRSSFQPPYIMAFEDSIDTEVEYELVRHYMTFKDKINGIDVVAEIAYYEIVSDEIPNLEELNRKIREQSCNEFYCYLKNGSTYGEYNDISFITDSFITYNDEDKLSILLDIKIEADDSEWNGYNYYNFSDSYIYGINVDLIDGEILDNSKIIKVDEDFTKAFRKQCCDQNGYDIDGLNNMSNKTLQKFLSSDESSVVFLTPLGLEYGYLYRSSSSNGQVTGWMTITLQNYFNLLQDEYRDLFEGTKVRPEKTPEEESEEETEEISDDGSSEEIESEEASDEEQESDNTKKNKKNK